jgi:HSP20 family protein
MLPVRFQRVADPMDALHREFDTVINRLWNSDNPVAWTPFCVDVREDGDHLFVEAELPGFKKEDVDITLENHALTISAERDEESNSEKKGSYLLNERRYNRFLRSFTLPPTVDDKHVDAKLDNGILSITLKKREETKPRKFAVS